MSLVPRDTQPDDKNPARLEKAVVDWGAEALREADGFMKSQPGYGKIDEIMENITGDKAADAFKPGSFSKLTLNHFAETADDLASALTDTKMFWQYKTPVEQFQPQEALFQKEAELWWDNRMIDLRFADVVKYALAAGSGVAHMVYDPEINDQNLIPEDPRDVLPIRPADNISIQNAFGVVVRRERTVNYLRQKYPQAANAIVADRDGSFGRINSQTRAQKLMDSLGLTSEFMQNLYSSLGSRPATTPLNVPTCDEFTFYVKDDSINQTSHDIPLGEGNWAYVVKPGQAFYPRKRCIVMTRTAKLYDGPMPYWHGLFPTPKLTLNPWPWLWLGKSPLIDLLTIQQELNRTARGVADLWEKNWRPDLIVDKNSIAKAMMDKIDTRRAGLKLRTNPVAGQGAQIVYPQNLQSAGLATAWIQFLIEEMKKLSGTEEITALAQLGQLPSTETIERMAEAMTPSVRLRSRVMEAFMREMAIIVLSNMIQFDTTAKRVQLFGAKGLTLEDVDADPGNLIPADFAMDAVNPLPRHERAIRFMSHFRFEISPGSLLSASGVTDKLMYLQLTRMGIMDPITLLEKLGVPNIGAPEEAGQTISSRMAFLAQSGFSMAVGPAGASAAGRKASGQSMPRLTVKES